MSDIVDKMTVNTTADAFAYCLIYLAGVDGEFDKSEAEASGRALGKLMVHFELDQDGDGDVDGDDLSSAISKAMETYGHCEDVEDQVKVLQICIAFLRECFSHDNLKVMVSEFRGIAAADGVETDGETGTIDILEKMILA